MIGITGRHDSVIVRTGVRLLAPLVQLFGLYVIFHGHYSPGGGFQGGVIIAASYILIGLGLGRDRLEEMVSEETLIKLAGLGVLVYAGVGAWSLFYGADYLDYGAITALDDRADMRRSLGILLVELGVAITVSSVLVLMFLRLTDDRDDQPVEASA